MTIERKVWDTLSAIDVSSFTEKKQNLTYLSWAHAYAIFSQHFPQHSYEFAETHMADGTVMMECKLTITEGEESMSRTGWLPCLDYRNKAIVNPDAMQINTTRMRVLVKTCSLMGLGLNVYQGEDLPVAEQVTKNDAVDSKQVKSMENMITSTSTEMGRFLQVYEVEELGQMTKAQYQHAMQTLNIKHQRMVEEAKNGTAE